MSQELAQFSGAIAEIARRRELRNDILRLLQGVSRRDAEAVLADAYLELSSRENRRSGGTEEKEGSKTDLILQRIRAARGGSLDIQDLAEAVYGDDAEGRRKIRGMLASLTHRGVVERVGDRRYRVAEGIPHERR